MSDRTGTNFLLILSSTRETLMAEALELNMPVLANIFKRAFLFVIDVQEMYYL